MVAELLLPHVPMSNPFVDRLIGSVRREMPDQTLFWAVADLENKLQAYQRYYNGSRTHSERNDATPIADSGRKVVNINEYRWKQHCRGLFQLPMAARNTISPGTGPVDRVSECVLLPIGR